MAESVSVASLTVMIIILFFVIRMYLAVKAACEQRVFQVQGPEMEGEQRAFLVQAVQMERQQRARHGAANPRREVQRNREMVNVRAATNRARPQEHDERLS